MDNLVQNLIENINEQAKSGIIFEFASAFDHHKIDLANRLEYLQELANIYCIDYVHRVSEADPFWKEFTSLSNI